ncbi:DUF5690 family protein [Segetibacter koreensis]|uniref:DUF5690 family protein n=1 Tax=Segetibacter koreensis TaxID=398037 RepID=UPI00035DA2E0|nr:DUF5690 family protein [Segetibacter koreensis]
MNKVQQVLLRSKSIFIVWSMIAAFGTYFCMYAFRKPFNAGTYPGHELGHIDYKAVLIVAQVIGYMLSKFIGIKVISELKPSRRKSLIIGLILFAEIALLLFGLIPPPYNFICLFLNGLPLGMVWGVVFSYLEGRRFTEVLGMGLSISLIISSGFLKTIYFYIHALVPSISEFWMPFVMGLLFLPLFLFFVWMLSVIPAPNQEDIGLRKERLPMTSQDKGKVISQFGSALFVLIIVYTFLTMLRDFRDNFSVEIWNEMDPAWNKDVFAQTETMVGLIVLIVIACLSAIKSKAVGFWFTMLLIFIGVALSGVSTLCFQLHWITPFYWMLLLGVGLFFAYIPIQIVLFERMIALFSIKANAGFFVYMCDSIGYLGSVGLLFYKEFFVKSMKWTKVLMQFSYLLSVVSMILLILSAFLFYKQYYLIAQNASKIKPAVQVV